MINAEKNRRNIKISECGFSLQPDLNGFQTKTQILECRRTGTG